MPTISDQLTSLIVQKNNLVDNLNSKGVTATRSEKLNTLVPKVLQINSGGGLDTSDANATSNDILLDKTAYVKGSKVTGSIKSKATATYVPSTEDQIISSGQYLSGVQTVLGDSNLLPENIKTDVTIFGVTGIHAGADELTEATATETDIKSGKIAYINGGEKVTGNVYTVENETSVTPGLKDQFLQSGFYNGISIPGDTELVPGNIKKGVEIFGITGIYEGSGGSPSSEQVVFECDLEASEETIVSNWKGLIKTKMETTYADIGTYVYNTISAIAYNTGGANTISGISYKNENSSNSYGFYFTSPISITSSTVLLYIRGFVSTWINPTVNINFVQADSVDDIETKINNNDFVYSQQIQIPNTINSTHDNLTKLILYFNLENIALSGNYYLYINTPYTGGNDAIMNKIVIINK